MSKVKYLSDDYKFIDMIGSGSFGEVYLVKDHKKREFAAKIEEKKAHSRLLEENRIYKQLRKGGMKTGLPKVYKFIEIGEPAKKFNVMIMDLLDKNLDQLFLDRESKFKISTVLKIGYDIIELLKQVHNAGFLHRDIKPNNFMIGKGKHAKDLYIMDFGLSKQFINKDGNHIGFKVERSLVGTARYTSLNVHAGLEPSRRDDLEAVGYMLVYFLKGTLPWKGLKKKNSNDDQIKMIQRVKLSTSMSKLCSELPSCFSEYIIYCRNLRFEEIPDYEYLKSLFEKTAKESNIIMSYEWLDT